MKGIGPLKSHNKKTGKWAAQIQFKGKKKYLGSYNTIEEAAKARREAESVYEEFLEKYEAGELGEKA